MIDYYLDTLIFPETMEHRGLKLAANGQDVGGNMLFEVKLGFSGTPSDLLPLELGRWAPNLRLRLDIITHIHYVAGVAAGPLLLLLLLSVFLLWLAFVPLMIRLRWWWYCRHLSSSPIGSRCAKIKID